MLGLDRAVCTVPDGYGSVQKTFDACPNCSTPEASKTLANQQVTPSILLNSRWLCFCTFRNSQRGTRSLCFCNPDVRLRAYRGPSPSLRTPLDDVSRCFVFASSRDG